MSRLLDGWHLFSIRLRLSDFARASLIWQNAPRAEVSAWDAHAPPGPLVLQVGAQRHGRV
jgi:hypothetical protein